MEPATIEIKKAREHNLRSVSLSLPRNALIVFTGVSGSGKSSLAFDTLYAEGQRRYIESLSSYARQFMGQMQKPDCDLITGLSPAIAIQQKTSGWNPRSTVGTITGIYDFLRVLYARVGMQHCTSCGRKIAAQSRVQIVEGILRSFDERAGPSSAPSNDTRVLILAPVARGQKGEFRDLFDDLIRAGYVRARVDGDVVELREDLALQKNQRHDIEVVIDRLALGASARSRLAEAVESALRVGKGTLIVACARNTGRQAASGTRAGEGKQAGARRDSRTSDTLEPSNPRILESSNPTEKVFSSKYACVHCSISFEPPTPQLLSFNSPTGMCLTCDGLGELFDFEPALLVPDPSLNFWAPCIAPMRTKIGRWRRHIYRGVAKAVGFDLDKPWKDLPKKARDALLYGTGDRHITYEWRWSGGVWKHGGTFAGVVEELRGKYRKAKASFVREYYEKFMRRGSCPDCGGTRLNEQALAVRLALKRRNVKTSKRRQSDIKPPMVSAVLKRQNVKTSKSHNDGFGDGGPNIQELCAMSVAQAYETVGRLALSPVQQVIAEEVLKEVRSRLAFLLNVGLHYLTLERTAPTLSGGELQRIRLAGQIGSGLVGVLYILDEPSIGLHARDNQRLLDSLQRLRDMGNTVIVVEHDEATMHAADHIVDFGPGPGVRGGDVVVSGTMHDLIQTETSLTGRYLKGDEEIAVPEKRRPVAMRPKRGKRNTNGDVGWLVVKGARHHNLKNIDVDIPLGRFVCVTGVSGSGKSSLVNDIIRVQLANALNEGPRKDSRPSGKKLSAISNQQSARRQPSAVRKAQPGDHDAILGVEHLDKVINIDQSPIGRTPRSNPATYVKVFDEVRQLFAKLPDSRVRGYKPGRFSFNVATGERGGGRCEACEGNGANKIEMDFLANVWVPCPVCEGRRFNHETLQIHYRGKSIYDVLDMDVQQALAHFEAIPKVRAMLMTLHDVGLDYVKLGQSSTTLSGGEAQRIKLARELVKRSTGRTLYLLDEPTTGLHFDDIRRLLAVLHGFVDAGNSVIVIEHNLDVIKTADWVIDLGPEGGDEGGKVVAAGTPEEVTACKASYTGASLREVLHRKRGNAETSKRRNVKTSKRQNVETSKHRNSDIPLALGGSPGFQNTETPHRDEILVVGAREHNLKDLTVGVPRGRVTVCSGVSGSGKSSFAMDTVYNEGQRRYVESLSAYARQFLGQLQKPKVDHVCGLSPAIAIEQKTATKSPRSTVGTVTEIYDYMRVLWARVGQPYCPRCDVPIGTQSSEEIVDKVVALAPGSRLLLCAPIERGPGETWEAVLERCRSQGYVRVRVDGEVFELSTDVRIDVRRRHVVELVVDRIVVRSSSRSRIADSVEHCLALGKGVLVAVAAEMQKSRKPKTENRKPKIENRKSKTKASTVASTGDGVMRLSQHLSCDVCGTSYDELTPHHFSFNSRLGWCPSCEGLGMQRGTRADTVIVRPEESILSGAIVGWGNVEERPLLRAMLVALAKAIGFDPALPCSLLTAEHRRALLFGLGDRWIEPETSKRRNAKTSKRQNVETSKSRRVKTPTGLGGGTGLRFQWKGFFPAIDEATKNSWEYRFKLQNLATEVDCQSCGGGRVRPEAAAVRLGEMQKSRKPKAENRKLKAESRKPKVETSKRRSSARGKTVVDVCVMSLTEAAGFFKSLRLERRQARIAGELLHEIKSRLRFLLDVGLGYLSLGRAAPTLSGGESQRIRLASQIGSGLTGVLYVLDEPTIGLHPRDNRRLIGALHKLRDLGNTLLMVEHDREVIEAADHLIDFGPGAGANGGHVVAAGSPMTVKRQGHRRSIGSRSKTCVAPPSRRWRHGRDARATEVSGCTPSKALETLTGHYLAGVAAIAIPTNRRGVVENEIKAPGPASSLVSSQRAGSSRARSSRRGVVEAEDASSILNVPPEQARGLLRERDGSEDRVHWLVTRGARQNNLRGIDVAFPLGRFICITGVSGSGKSSLITEILYPALASRIHRARMTPGAHDRIVGIDYVDKVINVDQQPIGNSPLSNPATYTGIFDVVRDVFAKLPDSRIRGYTANRFSFNRSGGRCDDCEGQGQVCHEMHFLPDVWVPCETCGGARYQRETLEVRYKGKNIADVLEMQVSEALGHFANMPKLRRLLQTLEDVGLGYLPLGQSAPTLSGGEAQRVKLAAELGRPNTGKTVYILDEPTTGLHFDDLRKLLNVLHRFVDLGNTVVCIEHNLDVIKTADWIIDLGPEAGDEGGAVVATGSPETVAGMRASHTGRLLKKVLAAGPHRQRDVFNPKKEAAASTAVVSADELAGAGPRIKMPWELDGRRWHTRVRLGRDGKPVQWEAEALEYVIEHIERLGKTKLLPTIWNDRARIEIKARAPKGLAQSAVPWFCHVLTGGRWLLDLLFRVPKGTFLQRDLAGRLKLKTLDDRDDVKAYGQALRVQIRPAIRPMDQVRVTVHDRAEIATPAFRAFVSSALKAYFMHVEGLAGNAAEAEPWKKDGKKWHLSQKSIIAKQPKLWRPMTLMAFLGMVNKAAPGVKTLWDRKAFVELVRTDGQRVGKIITNNGYALRVDLHVPRGRFTPTQVEHLGTKQEFARPGSSGAELTFWFQSTDEVHGEQLKRVVQVAVEESNSES